jgi:hypothetical protein
MAKRKLRVRPPPFSLKSIIPSQQKMLSMWLDRSPALSKMATDINIAETSLEEMKERCFAAEAPFKLDDDLRSAIFISEECIDELKKFEQFLDESLSLESYVKEQSKTKAMLLLIKYGNVSEFERSANSTIEQLSKSYEKLSAYREKLTYAFKSSNCMCEKCGGRGTIEEQKIIREQGSPPSVIISTSNCTACEGSGKTNLSPNSTKHLRVFLDRLNDILRIISENKLSACNAIASSFRAIQRDTSTI